MNKKEVIKIFEKIQIYATRKDTSKGDVYDMIQKEIDILNNKKE